MREAARELNGKNHYVDCVKVIKMPDFRQSGWYREGASPLKTRFIVFRGFNIFKGEIMYDKITRA